MGAGLNGSGMGGTNVAWAEKSYKLDPAYPQAVRAIGAANGTAIGAGRGGLLLRRLWLESR